MLVAVVGDVELDGRPRAVAVEHVVHAAVDVDDQRDRDHHQVEFLAEVLLDVTLGGEDGLLRLLAVEQRVVVGRQDLLDRAAARGEAGEAERSAHQLEQRAARGVVERRGAIGKLVAPRRDRPGDRPHGRSRAR